MGPRELAEAMAKKKKLKDKATGVVITPISVDAVGNVNGMTDDGKIIEVHAKNLEVTEGVAKSDKEMLDEMMDMLRQL